MPDLGWQVQCKWDFYINRHKMLPFKTDQLGDSVPPVPPPYNLWLVVALCGAGGGRLGKGSEILTAAQSPSQGMQGFLSPLPPAWLTGSPERVSWRRLGGWPPASLSSSWRNTAADPAGRPGFTSTSPKREYNRQQKAEYLGESVLAPTKTWGGKLHQYVSTVIQSNFNVRNYFSH